MNVVPVEFVRVMPDDMRKFVFDMYRRVNMSEGRSRLMARLLVNTDIRGVFSHGTRQSARYLRLLRDGELNPNPKVSIVQQTSATGTIDGTGVWVIFRRGERPAWQWTRPGPRDWQRW